MRFKLDENFGTRTRDLFLDAGHEVETVRSQGLQGAADERLYAICRGEGYCLVTFDLDFADVLRFPPFETNGIAVIRVPAGPSLELLTQLVRQFLQACSRTPLENTLWIVEPGRIRMHQRENNGRF